jgi:hypothetical protein
VSHPKLTEIVGYLTPTAVLAAVVALWKFLVVERVKRAEAERDEYKLLWHKEIRLGVRRALMPRAPDDPPPPELPLPDDWDEKSRVTKDRKEVEQPELESWLEQYVSERTPPKQMFRTTGAELVVIDDNDATLRAMRIHLIRIFPTLKIEGTVDPEQGRLMLLEPTLRAAIVDLVMPVLSGRDLITEILDVRPELRGRIVVCSGTAPDPDDPLFVEHGCLLLEKPVGLDTLHRIVQKALDNAPQGRGGE